jgi:hypothetical protein
VDVSDSPSTVSKICTSVVAQYPCAATSARPSKRLVRVQRKDRDSVVSSVYPG